jgi:hypothetical protein
VLQHRAASAHRQFRNRAPPWAHQAPPSSGLEARSGYIQFGWLYSAVTVVKVYLKAASAMSQPNWFLKLI